MKIVRELSKKADLEEIKQIYEKGHKLAVRYKKGTILAFADCIVDSEGENSLLDVEDAKVKDCFVLENNTLYAKDGELVVIDSVVQDKVGVIAECEVAEKDGRKFFGSYSLLDYSVNKEMVIASKNVYEVE